MKILLTTDVIHAGGAETFVLRLGQGLINSGHEVIVVPLYKNRIDLNIHKVLAPDVRLVPIGFRMLRLVQLFDGLLRKLSIDFSLLTSIFSRRLERIIKLEEVQVVHSHLFTADRVAVTAGKAAGVPVVTTLHGDYIHYHFISSEGKKIPFLNYGQKLEYVLKSFSQIVYISDRQNEFLKQLFGPCVLPLKKIYNGYDLPGPKQWPGRKRLGIPEDVFVFGMVARGIPGKGWEEAISSFLELGLQKTCLVLVGESKYVFGLKAIYKDDPRIIFVGYSPNPIIYINHFDVGIFTSTIYSESLPTVIIEYLSCQVPVITVDISECRKMVEADGASAGVVVPLKNGQVDIMKFCGAMRLIMQDKSLLEHYKLLTPIAYQKFAMRGCVEQYEASYLQALAYCRT